MTDLTPDKALAERDEAYRILREMLALDGWGTRGPMLAVLDHARRLVFEQFDKENR